jgi:hypothetical protein
MRRSVLPPESGGGARWPFEENLSPAAETSKRGPSPQRECWEGRGVKGTESYDTSCQASTASQQKLLLRINTDAPLGKFVKARPEKADYTARVKG